MSAFEAGAEFSTGATSTCALVQDLLPLYLEGEVSQSSRALIIAHLNECAHCAGFLAGARSTREQLRREEDQRQGARLGTLWTSAGFAELVVTVVAALCVAAVVGFAVISLMRLREMSLGGWLLFDMLLSPRVLYVLLSMLLLGATGLSLLKRELFSRSMWLLCAVASVGLGALGLLIRDEASLRGLLPLALLVAGTASLWYRWRELAELHRQDFARFAGVLFVSVGALMFLFLGFPGRLFSFPAVEPAPVSVDAPVPTAVPPFAPSPVLPANGDEMNALEAQRLSESSVYPPPASQVVASPTSVPFQVSKKSYPAPESNIQKFTASPTVTPTATVTGS